MTSAHAGQLYRAVAVALNLGVTGRRVPLGAVTKSALPSASTPVQSADVSVNWLQIFPLVFASV